MSLGKRLRLPKTLAFRLTLWYAVIFTVTSCIAFFLFYSRITSLTMERTDRDLLDQVDRFSVLLASRGTDSVADSAVIEAEAAAAGVKKVFFRFLSVNGQVFSSSNMSYWKDIDIDESAIRALFREENPVFQTISIAGRREKVRILYARLSPGIIMQVGQAMESYSRFLDVFQRVFIATMAFLIALSACVGWFMARRAVSGIKAVTRTARKISGGVLEERVPVMARDYEIDQLAITFNGMLDRIEALVAEIKEMSDNIAHDLRSPIAGIRGVAEVTLTSGKTLGEYEDMAAGTIEECDRLLDMINTMLMISKTESGAFKLSGEDIDISGLIRQACELFGPTAEDRKVDLNCDVPDGIRLTGDTSMIQRLISNLLDNAVKYTPSGGAVRLAVSENATQVVVSVKDTGIGISSTELPHIFERFYRCDRSRAQAGIGLGLSLAMAIARAHGGDITATSAPDRGSTFTVVLPKSLSRKS
ncbi:MAG: HAMP domain-containing protein [Acidobacteria bacterium]|nr:HAMP domain-containing protein [Acidobacteriota bacterium]